jgi:hypothetical protein
VATINFSSGKDKFFEVVTLNFLMEFMWLTLKNSVLTLQRTISDYITNTNKINSFYNTCLSSK